MNVGISASGHIIQFLIANFGQAGGILWGSCFVALADPHRKVAAHARDCYSSFYHNIRINASYKVLVMFLYSICRFVAVNKKDAVSML